MRILSLVATILGIAAIVFGVLFICQANAGNNEIVTSIAPLALNDVNPKYDAVTEKYNQVKMAEEPAIQGGTAAPSAMYNYLSAQKGLLGLAKANIGTVKAVRMMGYTNIAIGIGLAFTGFVLYRKSAA
jgi:hypothetical protein